MLKGGQIGGGVGQGTNPSIHFITKAGILETSGGGGGGCDGGRVLQEVGGGAPGRLAAFNFFTWVVVVLK